MRNKYKYNNNKQQQQQIDTYLSKKSLSRSRKRFEVREYQIVVLNHQCTNINFNWIRKHVLNRLNLQYKQEEEEQQQQIQIHKYKYNNNNNKYKPLSSLDVLSGPVCWRREIGPNIQSEWEDSQALSNTTRKSNKKNKHNKYNNNNNNKSKYSNNNNL